MAQLHWAAYMEEGSVFQIQVGRGLINDEVAKPHRHIVPLYYTELHPIQHVCLAIRRSTHIPCNATTRWNL
jgi:hypothetical protein